VFPNPGTGPAVPAGMDLIRTSDLAPHTDAQLARVLEIFESVGKRLGLARGCLRDPSVSRLGGAAG
jgi:hypothetical protein